MMADEKELTPESSGKPKKKMSAAAQKKLRYGGVATAITCVVTAVVIVLNILVSRIVEKYPLKLDLTESGLFEISQESIDYLKTVDMDVNFTVLMAESNFQASSVSLKMVSEMLERYAQNTNKIHVSYIDPTTNPDVVNTYQSNYAGTLTEGDIIISDAADPSKLRVVSMGSLFSYDQQKYALYYYYGQGTLDDCITGFSGEQNLTAALMYVTDADPIKVAVIATANGSPIYNQQYAAYPLAIFVETLSRNGYDTATVDLYTDTLDPEEYDMALLPAPVKDLTSTAIDNISAFLYNDGEYGRNLIYFADSFQGDTPNIDEMLSTWGIAITKNIALEGNTNAAQQVPLLLGSMSQTVAVPVAQIADDSYAEGMANTSLPIVAPLCRTIDLLWESQEGGITTSLLKTSDTVYLNEMGSNTENANTSAAGSQTIMAVSKRQLMINNIPHASSIMVLGSTMLSDYNVMQDASYNNANFLINAINTMAGKDSGLVIAEKQMTTQTLTMTAGELKGINLFIFAIPMAVMVTGIVVIVRRRNK